MATVVVHLVVEPGVPKVFGIVVRILQANVGVVVLGIIVASRYLPKSTSDVVVQI